MIMMMGVIFIRPAARRFSMHLLLGQPAEDRDKRRRQRPQRDADALASWCSRHFRFRHIARMKKAYAKHIYFTFSFAGHIFCLISPLCRTMPHAEDYFERRDDY